MSMDWSKAGNADQIYISDSSDLSSRGSFDLEMGRNSQSEVIDLDAYSPDPVHPQHDEISCKNEVLVVFPDICPDYLAQIALQHSYQPDRILSAILDKQEKTGSYPTLTSPESNPLKRKRGSKSNGSAHDLDHDRDDDNDGDADSDSDLDDERDPECVRSIRAQIAAPGYSAVMRSAEYNALAKTLLGQEFSRVPQSFIRASLRAKGNLPYKSVFEIYTAIDEAIRNQDNTNKPWQEKKTSTKANPDFTPDKLQSLDMSRYKPGEQAAFVEFIAARKLRAIKDARIAAEAEEHNNFLRAKNEDQTIDCGICFEEYALNRMVRCDGETMHWFCRKCLRTQAESLIGMAKYELTCMCLDGCEAGFSRGQRALFLNNKLTIALDRIEQETVLRMAGIENLETCPFCPYAAEYPPVEIDKEFRCENPRCQQVSCRLCRRKTHIPKTCAEVDADRGLDARHILEEAMSEALIRRCKMCQNAFVKTDGCNKIRCTKCGTLQCDVCRETIKDYSHFNDSKRGGKDGQCPLYDESNERYEKEVSYAEAETRKKIVAENPDLDEKVISVSASDKAHQDTNKRKTVVPALHQHLPGHLGGPLGDARHGGAVRPRPRAAVPPNDFQIHHPPVNRARNIDTVFPAPVFGPNGIMNTVNAADGVARDAQRAMKRKEPLMAFCRANLARSNATQVPVHRPLSLENILGKMENMTRLRLAEARRSDAEANRPIDVPQPNPFAIPPPDPFQQHFSQIHRTQGLLDPAQMGIHFRPFTVAPASLNAAGPLANHADPMEPLHPFPLDWNNYGRENQ